jgi:hypothetical protein
MVVVVAMVATEKEEEEKLLLLLFLFLLLYAWNSGHWTQLILQMQISLGLTETNRCDISC